MNHDNFDIDYYGNYYEGTFTLSLKEIQSIQKQHNLLPILNNDECEYAIMAWIEDHMDVIYEYIEREYEETNGQGYNHR